MNETVTTFGPVIKNRSNNNGRARKEEDKMAGIDKRRHRAKMNKQRRKQVKRGRVNHSVSNAERKRAKRLGLYSPKFTISKTLV